MPGVPPQPSPYAPPGTSAPPPALTPAGVAAAEVPAARADGRPALAIHNFSYYFLAFLAATFLGAGILALGSGIGVVLGLILLVCFVVSFSFPSLMWVAYVHHRRRGEPEPRQGVLTALAGGMLATVLPLFINSFVGAFNEDAASVLSAPLVEELSKALVLVIVLQEVNSRYDGLIYARTGRGAADGCDYSGPLARFTRDLAPAPYASGTHVLSPYIYSRYGIGFAERGIGVGPDGKCYLGFMYKWVAYAIAGFGPDGKPLPGKQLKGVVDDVARGKPQLVLNWSELVARGQRNLRGELVAQYKKLYYFVQLLKLYI